MSDQTKLKSNNARLMMEILWWPIQEQTRNTLTPHHVMTGCNMAKVDRRYNKAQGIVYDVAVWFTMDTGAARNIVSNKVFEELCD